jgi:hypothetical protein
MEPVSREGFFGLAAAQLDQGFLALNGLAGLYSPPIRGANALRHEERCEEIISMAEAAGIRS